LFSKSEEFNDGYWTKAGVSVVADTSISPSGVQYADTMTSTTVTAFVLKVLSIASATNYTVSFYAKEDTQRYVYIRFVTSTDNYIVAVYDLRDGVVGQTAVGSVSGTIVSATITPAANGFYRVTLVGSVIGTSLNAGISFATNLTGNTFTNLGTTSSPIGTSIFLWGAQLELGAFPTTYIPTSSASVTRNQDTFQLSNVFTNDLISSAGGTWFVDLRNNVPMIRDLLSGGVFINTGTAANINTGFAIRQSGGSNQRSTIFKVEAGSGATIYNTTTDTAKIAIKWNGATADIFVNGVKVVTATAFTATNMNNLIGEGQNRTLQINSMALYNTAISDAECIQITTL
jgi:hypothetical protein